VSDPVLSATERFIEAIERTSFPEGLVERQFFELSPKALRRKALEVSLVAASTQSAFARFGHEVDALIASTLADELERKE
jgi:hypothetical protein